MGTVCIALFLAMTMMSRVVKLRATGSSQRDIESQISTNHLCRWLVPSNPLFGPCAAVTVPVELQSIRKRCIVAGDDEDDSEEVRSSKRARARKQLACLGDLATKYVPDAVAINELPQMCLALQWKGVDETQSVFGAQIYQIMF